MKGFVAALEEKLGESCQVEAAAPGVYRIECGDRETGVLRLLFYRAGAKTRVKISEPGYVHVDEDYWVTQPAKLLARLMVRAGRGFRIHARETVVARVDKKQAMDFQRSHHLHVPLPGKFRYGLFFQGELVSVAVFSGGRKMRNQPPDYRSYELLRFCHKGEWIVVGGLSKLIRQFVKEHHPGDLMTYSDRDWSDGSAYEQLGFEVRGATAPQTFWIEGETMQRYAISELPPPFDPAHPGSFFPVSNRGSLKLVKRLRHQPIVILGPTASGKTRLAVELARHLRGAIISADSRQVYRGLNIGTGKDLDEYGDIPYYLIDIVDAGERYHIADYLRDAAGAFEEIYRQGRVPIICGGTGLYLQALLQGFPYSDVPTDAAIRHALADKTLAELQAELAQKQLPPDFRPDISTKKRLIRAIEIAEWTSRNPTYQAPKPLCPHAMVYGIAPDRESRRKAISKRLKKRLAEGLLEEVQGLLDTGLTADQLTYYGLEYKYCTLYLTGQLDRAQFLARLETEIHRYAKRQMTYFRKMEKDGIAIHWLDGADATIAHILSGRRFSSLRVI